MQREIIFDPLSAGAVSELLASMAEMEKNYNAKKNELTTIMLTAARMSGAIDTDVVRLNDKGTGVIVESVEEPSESMAVSTTTLNEALAKNQKRTEERLPNSKEK